MTPSSKPSKPTAAGHMERQPHGGALRRGGTNRPGSGRPPSVLRDRLRGSYAERMAFLDAVVDGAVMQRIEVPLVAVLPHVVCPNCGESPVVPKGTATALMVSIEARASASVKDRIAAMEQMAKYGLGQLKEISVENVRERVQETLRIIGQHCSPEQAETIYQMLEPVWR